MEHHEYASHPQPFGVPSPSPAGGRGRWIGVSAVVALLVAAGGLAVATHNLVLGRSEAVNAAWAQVESNLQRRRDLVPRLVETVNRYLRHESELLEGVTRERATAAETAISELRRAQGASGQERTELGATGAGSASPSPAGVESLARHEAAVGRGVRAVLAVAERYPELRSSDQFLALQAQLEGSENRINVARMAYNDAVRAYNAALQQIPTRWVAEAQGLEPRAYFRADEDARVAGPLAFE